MASVTIDIPNVGKVVAENAASEDTLLKILAAVQKSEKSKRDDERKNWEKLKKDQDQLGTSAKKASKDLDDLTDAAEQSTKKMVDADKRKGEATTKFTTTMDTAKSSASAFAADLGKSAVKLTAQFASSYSQIANDPIKASAGVLNTAIDLSAQGLKLLSSAALGTAGALASMIPLFGSAISKGADKLDAFTKATIDLAAELSKTANEVLASEFKNTAQALRDYTKIGASFAGGLLEMRTVSHQAGLTMEVFGKVVAASTENIRAAGMTQGEGAMALSVGMRRAADITGRSGFKLRDEMLALGYSYEEQGEIMSQFMAQQKASGQLSKMTTDEIAAGTRKYAADLKVLSDITGQDAKKLQERARVESMRGALTNKLNAEQQKAFKDSFSTLATFPGEAAPKMQQALMQILAGDVVTDPVIAANSHAMEMLTKTADQIRAGNTDMVVETQKNAAEMASSYKESGETATSVAALLSPAVSGIVKDMAVFGDALRTYQLDPDAAKKSKEAAELQATNIKDMSAAFVAVTASTQAFAVTMQTLATDALPTYGKILETLANQTTKAIQVGIGVASGSINPKEAYDMLFGKTASGAATPTTPSDAGVIMSPEEMSMAPPPAFANGGVADGPTSGYTAKLHGTEAVVPLPGDRSIPVNINDSSSGDLVEKLSSAMEAQGAKLDQLIRIMEDNRTYTERLLHTMS